MVLSISHSKICFSFLLFLLWLLQLLNMNFLSLTILFVCVCYIVSLCLETVATKLLFWQNSIGRRFIWNTLCLGGGIAFRFEKFDYWFFCVTCILWKLNILLNHEKSLFWKQSKLNSKWNGGINLCFQITLSTEFHTPSNLKKKNIPQSARTNPLTNPKSR